MSAWGLSSVPPTWALSRVSPGPCPAHGYALGRHTPGARRAFAQCAPRVRRCRARWWPERVRPGADMPDLRPRLGRNEAEGNRTLIRIDPLRGPRCSGTSGARPRAARGAFWMLFWPLRPSAGASLASGLDGKEPCVSPGSAVLLAAEGPTLPGVQRPSSCGVASGAGPAVTASPTSPGAAHARERVSFQSPSPPPCLRAELRRPAVS